MPHIVHAPPAPPFPALPAAPAAAPLAPALPDPPAPLAPPLLVDVTDVIHCLRHVIWAGVSVPPTGIRSPHGAVPATF